jgi:hypothetical protein
VTIQNACFSGRKNDWDEAFIIPAEICFFRQFGYIELRKVVSPH